MKQVETQVLAPPSVLLSECKVNRVEEDTVKSLAKAYIKNNQSIRECNNNITAIRNWVKEQGDIYDNTKADSGK